MITLNISRILVPYDFSGTCLKAVKHAALLAKKSKGELFLFYAERKKAVVEIGLTTAQLRQIAGEKISLKEEIETTANEIRKTYEVPVKVLVGHGNHIPQILKAAEKWRIGLIVMGTRGSDSANNLFTGSNSHKVVSKSEIPVMTVRGTNTREGYQNILLPVDSSVHTRQKVAAAVQVAKLFGSNIHLLGLLDRNEADYRPKLEAVIRQIEKVVKGEDVITSSEIAMAVHPAGKIMAAARRHKADIIITMTDQKTKSSRSYDRELVDDSQVPVLSIPPEIHEENIEPASIGGLW